MYLEKVAARWSAPIALFDKMRRAALIDLLAILPFYVHAFVGFDLRMLRIFRLMRLLKLQCLHQYLL